MDHTSTARRIGPFKLLIEVLRWSDEQLDKLGEEITPKFAGYARLLILCFVIAVAGSVALSASGYALRGIASAPYVVAGWITGDPDEAAPRAPLDAAFPLEPLDSLRVTADNEAQTT
jgi:hypothetical protein